MQNDNGQGASSDGAIAYGQVPDLGALSRHSPRLQPDHGRRDEHFIVEN
jgi:hypothetical protein